MRTGRRDLRLVQLKTLRRRTAAPRGLVLPLLFFRKNSRGMRNRYHGFSQQREKDADAIEKGEEYTPDSSQSR